MSLPKCIVPLLRARGLAYLSGLPVPSLPHCNTAMFKWLQAGQVQGEEWPRSPPPTATKPEEAWWPLGSLLLQWGGSAGPGGRQASKGNKQGQGNKVPGPTLHVEQPPPLLLHLPPPLIFGFGWGGGKRHKETQNPHLLWRL